MNKIVFLDFASEINRGDAIMQEVFYNSTKKYLRPSKISVISVYGDNQDYKADQHFDLTSRFKPEIYPNLRNSGNKLSSSQTTNKSINIINLGVAILQLFWLKIFGSFLKRPDQKYVLNSIKEADYVIWNGRNFRNRKGVGELYDILCMIISVQIALILGKKVHTIGVSIWPLKLKLSRVILARTLAKCEFVSVRETSSQKYAQSILNLTNVRLDPDLSFASMPFNGLTGSAPRKPLMFITIVDWTESGFDVRQNYINGIIKAIRWGKKNGFSVTIVPQVHYMWEDYRNIQSQIVEEVNVEIIDTPLDHEQLLELYRTGSILIATRMHSAIFALSEGCKVLAISYDTGAKWSILTDAGLKSDYLLNMENLKPQDMDQKLNELLNDEDYWPKIIDGYKRNKENVNCVFEALNVSK